jgi:sugar diacid utilization regulator
MSASPATAAIVQRVRERVEDVARASVERFRREIVDYASVDDEFLYGQTLPITRHNLVLLLDNLEQGTALQTDQLDLTREGAARRVHQGISLASIQAAYRVFGEEVWAAILESAMEGSAEERDAALAAAQHVMRHVTLVSDAGTQAYLDESEGVWSDREIIRRDLLEALLTGRAREEATRRDARVLGIGLCDDYVVVVGRASDVVIPTSDRRLLRKAAEIAREHLRTDAGPALIGLREREVVALCPASSHDEHEGVKRAAANTAAALADHALTIGVGGLHRAAAGVPTGYAEAREAAGIAARAGVVGRAVAFDEVLLDHVLRSSPHAARIVEDTIAPLREYDRRRNASLVDTLSAYLDCHFNLTRSAERLSVHPNTVTYRLDRIKTLTGRDPANTDDLILLALGLKLGSGATQ